VQYHLDGFTPGDPALLPPAAGVNEPGTAAPLDDIDVDVLIVGCGPAGLTLATQLSAFPDITTRIVDLKLGPLRFGQADGVACRSMEMFEAFGFSERVLKESYWVSETSFWRPDPAAPDRIARADRIQDVEDGLSEFPHTILNQARIHDFYLETMVRSPRRLVPDYGRRFTDLTIEPDPASTAFPVTATLERVDPGHEGESETVRARYVVGCDGARSLVRRSLGIALRGDAANKIWGVADLLAVTDFPDIRLKSAIQSATSGSVLVIPREGGYLFRMYTELGELEPGERAADRAIDPDDIIAVARRVLHPYTLDVKEVAWWSVYEIGQRLSDTFDDVSAGDVGAAPRVFITGDACHTHSPKAGQGMNVSMADSYNLGWKLASVVLARCTPGLLGTHSVERQAIAQELIDFDRDMETLFAARAEATEGSDEAKAQQAKFQEYFTHHARFTAGVETRYGPSLITHTPIHQHLATGMTIGKRFHSEAVVRLGDAKPVHLGHTISADGRWRIFAFADAGDPSDAAAPLARLCEFLGSSPDSPVVRYTPVGADVDSVIDVRAVCQQYHRDLALERLPSFLLPRKGPLGLVDYEKIFCPDLHGGPDIFDSRGIDRANGCMIVVRPDQHVAHILPLDAHEDLSAFFTGFMLDQPAT
jgi:phenol 2-monooxygenase